MDPTLLRRRGQVRLALIAAGFLLVAVAGYAGFVWFVRSDRAASSGVLVVGVITGFAAFFSPCSFPLLLTFLARRAEESRGSAFISALRVGLGATLMLAALGLVMAAGGAAIGTIVQFDQPLGRGFRLLVGALLVFLGLRQARLVTVRLSWLDSFARAAGQRFDRSKRLSQGGGDVVYGFGYLLAGLG